ncbi:MAG: indolepyruvate ferredoxin oxidoreductase subunit alpha [Alphaproteobacteria bacterium]|nr:indolepyruvate ferredoxin oxidoreductase subunit alpha [Alphaproteobacteria bacterium]
MERSFAKEVELLKKGDGEIFEGEGILAITKALLQAGVSYVTGYQGAPVSHLMDVLADAHDVLDGLGVHFEPAANEAGAAAMLAASINYPMRGAAVWKSTVGTNVASDALSNLASAGVKGGVLIVMGEDYGEGASIIQERSHAFAMKSSMWLMDPRPDHTRFVELIEKGFALSEASNAPVMMEFRIRACHMHGRFATKANRAPLVSRNRLLQEPDFDYSRICLPPSTYLQEKHKIEQRFPAAIDFIRAHKLNDHFAGRHDDVGIICQGGLFNTVIRALQQLGLADAFGEPAVPILALNVTYPLVPEEVAQFCAGKRAVLMVEEGNPDYLEQAVGALLRKHDINTTLVGKGPLPIAGEYTADVMLTGLAKFIEGSVPRGVDLQAIGAVMARRADHRARAAELLGAPVPKRPPGFCVGCPERPVFSAIKLVEREVGRIHVAADIGCHSFSTLPPFNLGNSILGYGLGLSSAAAVAPAFARRVVSVMGDGGFWHNGLSTGVSAAVINKQDGVLIVMDNGYSSATGQQLIPSSRAGAPDRPRISIEQAVRMMGVKAVETIRTYSVGTMVGALRRALKSGEKGLKVIVAAGECQLARQRRIKPEQRAALARGERVVRTRYGVDDAVCTGDHSCIRLSGCPSLTIKDSKDPLKTDPVAAVNNDCVGCGLCGEVADAAVLCPSFYRADIVQNANWWDRLVARLRGRFIARLQARAARNAVAA